MVGLLTCVLRDESGQGIFPFSCLAHVTLLYPVSGPDQDELRIYSGLLTLRTISGGLRRSMNCDFNSSIVSLEFVRKGYYNPRLSKANSSASHNLCLDISYLT